LFRLVVGAKRELLVVELTRWILDEVTAPTVIDDQEVTDGSH
jgi:hypothetical protein